MAAAGPVDGMAVVTGAAGGMGSAVARALAAAGWGELLLCDLQPEPLEAVAAMLREGGARVEVLAGDMAEPAWCDRLLAGLGGRAISALVHTAGLSPTMGGPERILAVNLDATARLVEAAGPRMAGGAAAVLFASNSAHMPMPSEAAAAFWAPLPAEGSAALAHLAPTPSLAYPLSKIGVRALAKRAAKAWGERGARIVSLSPGAIDTAMGRQEGAASPMVAEMAARSALGRLGRPEELAAVAVFLCSPAASFVSGVDWLVDGGQTAALGF